MALEEVLVLFVGAVELPKDLEQLLVDAQLEVLVVPLGDLLLLVELEDGLELIPEKGGES